ncbi:hypothetical protein P7F88_25565 [Vibrio hannami]|uniref:hypothetical protein n=1 Tax=Vibrio hannami TaxID=2717094 RepID=UPI00240F032B|nr:hypothetical protein [Vibrio hannami]MDG3089235.1 hypothetical protein [Vibrio hannami]
MMSDPDRPYVANITMRHVQQRTAALYAKNPRFRFKKSKRLMSSVWDGTAQQLQVAKQMLAGGGEITQQQAAMAILADAQQSRTMSEQTERMGKTLSILYEYEIKEQEQPTKKMMKKQVRSSLINGVAYFKQTFQRANELSPDGQAQVASHMQRIAEIERLASDLQDGEIHENEAEYEQLLQMVKVIEEQEQIVVSEGLRLDYPDSRNIIPDRNLTYLPGFVGCSRVSEKYELTTDQIKAIYKVDVTGSHETYKIGGEEGAHSERSPASLKFGTSKPARFAWCAMATTITLSRPHTPTTYTDRFYPWFVFAPNAMDDGDDPFPPSDVDLMLSQQAEINRAGEALRDHRHAARPGWVASKSLPDVDAKTLSARTAHSVIPLLALAQGQKISDLLQPFPVSAIDPNLYNTGPAFQDVLRSVGTQEANLGGTSNATATESNIAEGSRQSVLGSSTDELDDLLTEMARAGGQILLQEMDAERVTRIVETGALWPTPDMQAIADEIEARSRSRIVGPCKTKASTCRWPSALCRCCSRSPASAPSG